EAARSAALQAESLSGQPLNEDSVAPLTALVTKARFEYLRAANFYKAASDAWFEINSRNIGKAYRGYAGQRMAPGS
ncbi:MAG TPA: hypothetical protein PKY30_27105, partial [Myxococcota bacterium]|nr:hypothetical protein [Myxococcota bacterium]